MSVCGYVPDAYTIMQRDGFKGFPYRSVVTKATISCKRLDHSYKELPFPVLIYQKPHKLDFEINVAELIAQNLLPQKIEKQKITLQLFEGLRGDTVPAQQFLKVDSFDLLVDDTNKRISGNFQFKISGFQSLKRQKFLYIALQIHECALQYLVYDVASFSSRIKLTDDDKILMGVDAQTCLSKVFWFKQEFISTKPKKVKKEKAPEEGLLLQRALQATEDHLHQMQKIPINDSQDAHLAFKEKAKSLIETLSQLFDLQKVPPVPPQSPKDGILGEPLEPYDNLLDGFSEEWGFS